MKIEMVLVQITLQLLKSPVHLVTVLSSASVHQYILLTAVNSSFQ